MSMITKSIESFSLTCDDTRTGFGKGCRKAHVKTIALYQFSHI